MENLSSFTLMASIRLAAAMTFSLDQFTSFYRCYESASTLQINFSKYSVASDVVASSMPWSRITK